MNVQNICIKNRLLVNVCHIVISSHWLIKLWEFNFPKFKNKNHPPFSWFREFAFPIEKIPLFGEMGTSMDVRFGQDCRDRTGMGSPIGGSPHQIWTQSEQFV